MSDQQQPTTDHHDPDLTLEHIQKDDTDERQQNPYEEFSERLDRLFTRFRRRRSTKATDVVNTLTLVVLAIGTAVAIGTLKTLNRSVAEMVKQTPQIQRSADAAADSAAAAKASAEAALASNAQNLSIFMAQQRAKLSLSVGDVKMPITDNILDVRFPLDNSGGSTATIVRAWAIVSFDQPNRPPTIAENQWVSAAKFTRLGDVLPGEKGTLVRVDSIVGAGDLIRFRTGADAYIHLRLRYCDVFNVAHWIHQCWQAGLKTPAGFMTSCGDSSGDETPVASQTECR